MFGRLGANNPHSKPIVQKDLQGNIIAEYVSASDVERKLNYNASSISGVINGRCKQAYGFIWEHK